MISPLDESSVINNILKRQGSGAYHICYRTGDINSKLKIRQKDNKIVSVVKLTGEKARKGSFPDESYITFTSLTLEKTML